MSERGREKRTDVGGGKEMNISERRKRKGVVKENMVERNNVEKKKKE